MKVQRKEKQQSLYFIWIRSLTLNLVFNISEFWIIALEIVIFFSKSEILPYINRTYFFYVFKISGNQRTVRLRDGYWNGTSNVSNFVPPADSLDNIYYLIVEVFRKFNLFRLRV